jgi:hypothetical protein
MGVTTPTKEVDGHAVGTKNPILHRLALRLVRPGPLPSCLLKIHAFHFHTTPSHTEHPACLMPTL